jgi:hypothetical protein
MPKSARAILFALVVASLATAQASADVVHLKTGGTINGTVVKDDEKGVVVRTPNGKVTLPRRIVVKIVRQDPGATALGLARERAKSGAYAEAQRLFEKAAKSEDKATAKSAKAELARMQRRMAKSKTRLIKPRAEWKLPEGVTGVPFDGETLQEQFDRARRAIETGDGGRALRLLKPLLASKPDAPDLQFLVARATEMHTRKVDARELYVQSLGNGFKTSKRPTTWLRELARRKLSGEKLRSRDPGVGSDWQRLETRHFAVYSLSKPEPWVALELERAFQDTLDTFTIEAREVYFPDRVLVYLYPGPKARADVEGRGPLGHGSWVVAPDGPLQFFSAYANRPFFEGEVRHLVAHTVLRDIANLDPWAEEGAARFVEPPSGRAARRAAVRSRTQRPALSEVLAGDLPRGESQFAQDAFDAQAAVLFETLVDRLSPKKTLKLCKLIKAKGAESALKRFKIELDDLDRLFLAKAGSN